ncbi:MAG TPA: fatty acid desaturase [Thermoanaerobaculia bacterium]
MRKHYDRVNWDLISDVELHRFSSHNVWRWLAAVAFEWIVITALFAVAFRFPHWYVWLPVALLIGTRQHGLAVLAHDGAHHLVVRSHFWNDVLTNYFTTYPLTFTVQGYRTTHLQHHWYLETPEDPSKVSVDKHPEEWTFPMPKRNFIRMFLRDLTLLSQRAALSLMKYLWDIPGGRTPHVIRIAVMHAAAIAAFAYTGHLWAYLLLWIVPLYTVTVACYRLRSVAEHSGIGPQSERYSRNVIDNLRTTRTTTGSGLSQYLLIPYNVSYHIEHHLFPSIPTFNLRGLHAELENNPVYVENAHITRGHRELFRELTGTPAAPPPVTHGANATA